MEIKTNQTNKVKIFKKRSLYLWGVVRKILPMQTTSKGKGMDQDYWLEKLDPEHRYSQELKNEFIKWLQFNNGIKNFFQWVDKNETTEKKKIFRIHYLMEEEKKIYKLFFDEKTKKVYQNGNLFDTMNFPPINEQLKGFALFVIDLKKNFLAGPRYKGYFQHSSFVAGDKVRASGIIRCKKGVLKIIMQYSGHYKPGEIEFKRTLESLPEVFLNNVIFAGFKFQNKPFLVKYLQKKLTNNLSKVYVCFLKKEKLKTLEVKNYSTKIISEGFFNLY